MRLQGVGGAGDGVGGGGDVEVDEGGGSFAPAHAHHHPVPRVAILHALDAEARVEAPRGGPGLGGTGE